MAIKRKGVLAGLAIAGLAATGVIAVGGSAFADSTASPSPAASSSQEARPGGHGHGPGGQSQATAVTGDEAQKVIDAVQAKNNGVKITTVRKDTDGSYHALGTKADGTNVMYEVSTDLATITEAVGHGHGPGGGHGR